MRSVLLSFAIKLVFEIRFSVFLVLNLNQIETTHLGLRCISNHEKKNHHNSSDNNLSK